MKWVGGKTRLLPELLARVPDGYRRYYEPFAGGAALFFALRPEQAIVSDANPSLMLTYACVGTDVEAVIAELDGYERTHGETRYYRARDKFNERLSTVPNHARAAAFLYLNRAGYNGLWRVNKAGDLNVPFGHATKIQFDVDNLRAASRAICRPGVELRCGGYRDALHDAGAGDFVYLDPPYDDTFNAYTSEGTFDQAALAETVRELVARGCHVMLSNSDTPRVRELYADLEIEVVRNQRSVNSDGAGRGEVDELIITNRQRRAMSPRPPEQQYFDGMRPADEPNVEEVKQAIYLWLDAKVSQKRAAEETKQKHAQMLTALAENELDWHPYLDPHTQKKKRVFIAKEPKAKTTSAPKEPGSGKRARRRGGPSRDIDADLGEDNEPEEDDTVESRRVPRESVAKEIDPFGSTRDKMSGGVLDPTASNGATTDKAKRKKPTKAKKKGKGK